MMFKNIFDNSSVEDKVNPSFFSIIRKSLIGKIAAYGLAIALIFGSGHALIGCNDTNESHPRCQYVDYIGTATIISVQKTEDSIGRSGPCYEGYEVLYKLSDDIASRCSEDLGYYNNNEWTFLLTNSWSPGPLYIGKYGLEPGAIFQCTLSVQRSGMCTPCIIKLDGVDNSDYFECSGGGSGSTCDYLDYCTDTTTLGYPDITNEILDASDEMLPDGRYIDNFNYTGPTGTTINQINVTSDDFDIVLYAIDVTGGECSGGMMGASYGYEGTSYSQINDLFVLSGASYVFVVTSSNPGETGFYEISSW